MATWRWPCSVHPICSMPPGPAPDHRVGGTLGLTYSGPSGHQLQAFGRLQYLPPRMGPVGSSRYWSSGRVVESLFIAAYARSTFSASSAPIFSVPETAAANLSALSLSLLRTTLVAPHLSAAWYAASASAASIVAATHIASPLYCSSITSMTRSAARGANDASAARAPSALGRSKYHSMLAADFFADHLFSYLLMNQLLPSNQPLCPPSNSPWILHGFKEDKDPWCPLPPGECHAPARMGTRKRVSITHSPWSHRCRT